MSWEASVSKSTRHEPDLGELLNEDVRKPCSRPPTIPRARRCRPARRRGTTRSGSPGGSGRHVHGEPGVDAPGAGREAVRPAFDLAADACRSRWRLPCMRPAPAAAAAPPARHQRRDQRAAPARSGRTRVRSGRRDVASAGREPCDRRRERRRQPRRRATISTAAAGTSAANRTDEHHTSRTRGCSSTARGTGSENTEYNATAASSAAARARSSPRASTTRTRSAREEQHVAKQADRDSGGGLAQQVAPARVRFVGRASGSHSPSPAASAQPTTSSATALGANAMVCFAYSATGSRGRELLPARALDHLAPRHTREPLAQPTSPRAGGGAGIMVSGAAICSSLMQGNT